MRALDLSIDLRQPFRGDEIAMGAQGPIGDVIEDVAVGFFHESDAHGKATPCHEASSAYADVDDNASAHLALDDVARGVHDIVERNMRRHRRELGLCRVLSRAGATLRCAAVFEHCTLSTPSSATARRMNGATVVGRSMP